jgi:hypothetical protein
MPKAFRLGQTKCEPGSAPFHHPSSRHQASLRNDSHHLGPLIARPLVKSGRKALMSLLLILIGWDNERLACNITSGTPMQIGVLTLTRWWPTRRLRTTSLRGLVFPLPVLSFGVHVFRCWLYSREVCRETPGTICVQSSSPTRNLLWSSWRAPGAPRRSGGAPGALGSPGAVQRLLIMAV